MLIDDGTTSEPLDTRSCLSEVWIWCTPA